MGSPRVISVSSLNGSEVDEFLKRVFGEKMSEFLHHSGWLYRGNQHSLAAIAEGKIVAYCGVAPTKVFVNGVVHSGLWWMHLIVAPEFRRRGYETTLDKTVREMEDIIIGFPNKLASKIHRKHGWEIRNDVRLLFLPLRPAAITERSGLRAQMLRLTALGMSPLAAIARHRFSHYRPTTAHKLSKPPDTTILAQVFFKYSDYYKRNQVVTTYRDAEFIEWRYAECSYRSQLEFYTAGQADSPSLVLITRVVDSPEVKEVRILDIFGDLADRSGLRDILRLVIRDAVCQGSSRVITKTSLPVLHSLLRSVGFLYSTKGIFCWYSKSQDLMQVLRKSNFHWTLADSDAEFSYGGPS
jgi:GNAT superfamily N-acetyltransferase